MNPARRDVLALFCAQFHVTKGNLLEWSLRTHDDLNLDGVEFSVLPSGSHLIEQDVVYFSISPSAPGRPPLQGLSVFRRLPTDEQGQRGARLASLGAIVEPGAKPWRHVNHLKEVFAASLQASAEDRWNAPTRFFDTYSVLPGPLPEPFQLNPILDNEEEEEISQLSPLNHLPHLLPILGPLVSTLHKHILSRRRILIYCKPPVEGACVLAWICGFLGSPTSSFVSVQEGFNQEPSLVDIDDPIPYQNTAQQHGFHVLGCISLSDMDRLDTLRELKSGWVACTTDALYLEKPAYYDLLIDLTTLKTTPAPPPSESDIAPSPNRRRRPTFHSSSGGQLSPLRWGWSDIKPWMELERINSLSPYPPVHLHSASDSFCCSSDNFPPDKDPKSNKLQTIWSDLWIWRIYEDVCLVCAGLFFSSANSNSSEIHLNETLNGDRDPPAFNVKNVGSGIQGGKKIGKQARRSSGMTELLSNAGDIDGTQQQPSPTPSPHLPNENLQRDKRETLKRTTRALLQTFHAHAQFQQSLLRELIASKLPIDNSLSTIQEPQGFSSSSSTSSHRAQFKSKRRLSLPLPSAISPSSSSNSTSSNSSTITEQVTLLPRDLLSMSLNPWSTFDAKFVEWLAESLDTRPLFSSPFTAPGESSESVPPQTQRKVKVVVKRSWSGYVGVLVPSYYS